MKDGHRLGFAILTPSERRAIASGARHVYRVQDGVVTRHAISEALRKACRQAEPAFAVLARAREDIDDFEWRAHSKRTGLHGPIVR